MTNKICPKLSEYGNKKLPNLTEISNLSKEKFYKSAPKKLLKKFFFRQDFSRRKLFQMF